MSAVLHHRLALLALASMLLSLTACGRSCRKDHPYVPYAVGDATSAEVDAGSLPAAASERPAEKTGVESALVAPPGTTSWKLEGLELAAPPDSELVLALVQDFDGDGLKDALAVARLAPPEAGAREGSAAEGARSAGAELLYYHGTSTQAERSSLAVAPARAEGRTMDQDGCTPVARLERVGPRSAFAELGVACPSGPATRAIYVVRLGGPAPTVGFDAVVQDPPSAPKLALDVDGADRDKDGIDDVALRVTIEGGGPPFEPGPRVWGKLAFFDRPAGPSRDPDEPEASLRAIAAQAAARAPRPKDAPSVQPLVQQLRALYRAMCQEGGAPRITKIRGGGAPVCGASKALEDAGVAQVRAFVTLGDALRAFVAAEVAQASPATRTAARTSELSALLAQVAPVAQARGVRVLGVPVDVLGGHHPEWGPLAFDASGKLLVRSGTHVARVDPTSGEAEDTDVPAWSSQVLSPDGKNRWLEAYHACEGVALRATFVATSEGDMRDVPLPVPPPLGTRCTGARGEAAPTLPIAWTARGLEALVAGQPLLVTPENGHAIPLATLLAEPPPFGSPRSPGARAVAVPTGPTGQGVLVKTERWSLYRAADLEPYAQLKGCTVTDDGARLACVRRGKVVVASF